MNHLRYDWWIDFLYILMTSLKRSRIYAKKFIRSKMNKQCLYCALTIVAMGLLYVSLARMLLNETTTVQKLPKMVIRGAGRNTANFGMQQTSPMHQDTSYRDRPSGRQEPRHLKVLVYDVRNLLRSRRPTLRALNKTRINGSWASELKFADSCSVELFFGNNLVKFHDADAVVFHVISATSTRRLPRGLNPNQAWIFFSWSTPKKADGHVIVDATWTYHRASDIRIPYGYYVPDRPMTTERQSPEQWVAGKTKKVLWIASHCKHTPWPRLAFVNELKKYIEVDVYGKCGNLTCDPHWSPKCMGGLLRQYKFYLALENRECEDYITEKAWEKPLQYGTVPVVYGPTKRDYQDVLPPKSFIHLSEFGTVKALADYLLKLDANPDLYTKYLEWRYHGHVEIPRKMFDSFPPEMFRHLFPIVRKKKNGEMKRHTLDKTKYFKSCRDQNSSWYSSQQGRVNYGVHAWFPW